MNQHKKQPIPAAMHNKRAMLQLAAPVCAGVLVPVLAASIYLLGYYGWWLFGVVLTLFLTGLAVWFTRRHIHHALGAQVIRTQAVARQLQQMDEQTAAENEVVYVPELLGKVDEIAGKFRFFKQLSEGVYGIEAIFSSDLKPVWVSPSIMRLTGFALEQVHQTDDVLALLIDPIDLPFCHRMIAQLLQDKTPCDFEIRLRNSQGDMRWFASHWRLEMSPNGKDEMLRLSAEDIQSAKETEYRHLETVADVRRSDALRELYLSRSNDEKLRLSALLNVIELGILFVDRDQRVLYFNRSLLTICGLLSVENLIGMRDIVFYERIAPQLVDPLGLLELIEGSLRNNQFEADRPEIYFKDGRIVTCRSMVIEDQSGTGNIGRVWLYEDVTERRNNALRLEQLAVRDPLTDLLNRRRFHEDLELFLANASRNQRMLGMILIDLDDFKQINDNYGHQAGDEVLVALAREVGGAIRKNEVFYRIGGDEFCVLVSGLYYESNLLELARRISQRVDKLSFSFNGQEVNLSASLGIALYPQHAGNSEELVAAADRAMYIAKDNERGLSNIVLSGAPQRVNRIE